MRRLHILSRTSLLILFCSLCSFADSWIVQVNPSAANTVMQQYGGYVQQVLHGSDGVYRIWLPSGPLGTFIANALKSSPLVLSIEPDGQVGLPAAPTANTQSSTTNRISTLPLCPGAKAGSAAELYLVQKPNCIVNMSQAQTVAAAAKKKASGLPVTVAVIDTGVDFTHPVLAGSFAGALDFTGANDPFGTVAQETSPMVDQETSPMVDQETSPMVDSANTIILNQETSPMVDQETSPMVDASGNSLPKALGHGTMVAGIIHLVAPGAKIFSLKAFNNDGRASISTLTAALFAAADNPAVQVINASWSTTAASKTLQNAINYANSKGKIVVAAVANGSSSQLVFPAAYSNVIGVACTDASDGRCSFSNYGSDVKIAAPGSGITSTFPKGYSRTGYATGWGTSFSAPYVVGTIALMQSISDDSTGEVTSDLNGGARPLPGYLQIGNRLDALGAVTRVN